MHISKLFLLGVGVSLLSACGGGGDERVNVPVVYRDDGTLIVDGRTYERRTPEEIGVEFLPEGSVAPGLLNVYGKPGVGRGSLEAFMQSYGLSSHPPNCELFASENRCFLNHVVVPPEWTDQWRRAMADWSWVMSVEFERVSFHDQ